MPAATAASLKAPTISPLLRLSERERESMLEQMWLNAKRNVENMYGATWHTFDKAKKNQITADEQSRLFAAWMESHK